MEMEFYQEGLEAQARLSNEETYKTYRHLTCGTGATKKRTLMMKSMRRWKIHSSTQTHEVYNYIQENVINKCLTGVPFTTVDI